MRDHNGLSHWDGSRAVALSTLLWFLLLHYGPPFTPWAHHSLVCLNMSPRPSVLRIPLDKQRIKYTSSPLYGERDISAHLTSRYSLEGAQYVYTFFFHSNICWMSHICQGLYLGLRFKGEQNRHSPSLLRALTGGVARGGRYQINNPSESKIIF